MHIARHAAYLPWLALLFLAALFLAALVLAAWVGRLPPLLAVLYLLLSAIAFATYAWDKQAARRQRRRVRERTLHLLALLGGWPGALAAQRWLRHKSSKMLFLRLYWITVGFNCSALAWLLQASAAAPVRTMLEQATKL